MTSEHCRKYKQVDGRELRPENNNFCYVASRSKRKKLVDGSGIAKHWIMKFPSNSKDLAVEDRKFFFIKGGIIDSFFSRIIHEMYPHAPKGKFISDDKYVSRLPTYDGSEAAIRDIETLNLMFLGMDDISSVRSLHNLARSIVFCIVIGNDDNKLANLTRYPGRKAGDFEVFPFDLEFSLHTNPGLCKSVSGWEKEKVQAIIYGRDDEDKSKEIGVAEALLNAIGNFGNTTTSFYRIDPSFEKEKEIYDRRYRPKFIECLNNELDAINPNRTLALLTIFEEVLAGIETHKAPAYEKTLSDCHTKFLLGTKEREYCDRYMPICKSELDRYVDSFSRYISEIREETMPWGEFAVGAGGAASAVVAAPTDGAIAGAGGRVTFTGRLQHSPIVLTRS